MKIGILQTGHAPEEVLSELGDYDTMFMRLLEPYGFSYMTWSVVDNIFPPRIDVAEGWLITGSRFGAYDPEPWIPPLEDLIRDIHAAGLPMLGVCFGHQIIAQALGGRVEKFRGGWAVGRHPYRYKGQDVTVNAWHQDQVLDLPEGAEVIASSEFCENAGFVIDDTVWTIQPHPEFGAAMIGALAKHRAPGVVPQKLTDAAIASLGAPTNRHDIAADMAAFFKNKTPA